MSDGQATAEFQVRVHAATERFFAMMQERHLMGQEKYGPVKFMEANTLEEAMEEVIDLANYAMYTFVKLSILNEQQQKIVGDIPDQLGPQSFMKG